MFQKKKILGLVTARSGSKGLPGKNFKPLNGKPLVQYALEAGLHSQFIDKVVLTSNCQQCIKIATKMGCEPPFVRPEELSTDKVSSFDVIKHAIEFLEAQGEKFDLFVLIEPTSPLRTSKNIDEALELMFNTDAQSLVSVARMDDQHPNFVFKRTDENKLAPWLDVEFSPLRRQDVTEAFYLEGSVYITFIETFLQRKAFCHDNTSFYEVPKWMAPEVDDIWDFIYVEAIQKHLQDQKE